MVERERWVEISIEMPGTRCSVIRDEILCRRIAEQEAEIAALRERVDLDVDEFRRIRAELGDAGDGILGVRAQAAAKCVFGLVDRAVAAGRQRVPLIEQRDRAERRASLAQARLGLLTEAARKIRHWHDRGDGMVVSADAVRGLWAVLNEIEEGGAGD